MFEWDRGTLALVILLGGFLALIVWIAPEQYSTGAMVVLWALRLALLAAVLAAATGFCMLIARKETLPDYLAEVSERYFERRGVCFVPRLAAIDGVCWIELFFQNRFSGRCQCAVTLMPGRLASYFGSEGVATVEVYFECPGAAFGVARVPYAVPTEYQGGQLLLKMGAQTRYPDGRGTRLRFRRGSPVEKEPHQLGLHFNPVRLVVKAVLATYSMPGAVEVRFPEGVATAVEEREAEVQVLNDPFPPVESPPVRH